MLPDWITEYFSFHKKERRGILFLVLMILLLGTFNIYQRVFWKDDWEDDLLEFGPQIIAFKEEIDSVQNSSNNYQPWTPRERTLAVFDPNTLDSTGWVGLGFSPKQTVSILKYRKAGAVFRKPEDIKKLFMVDEELFKELQPYISINPIPEPAPTNYPETDTDKPKFFEKEKVIIELNSADTTELIKLYGIGSSFAKRIVKYRELLGGYLYKEQVLEVYGMDTLRFSKISDNLLVDPTQITRININEADVKQLMRHPYLNANQARAIVNYRKQHGNFKQLSELENIYLLKGEPYRKIAPYFATR